MGRLGFEPRTNRLKAECSTAELATPKRDIRISDTITQSSTQAQNIASQFALPPSQPDKVTSQDPQVTSQDPPASSRSEGIGAA